MRLKNLELNGFKSFHKKTVLEFSNPIVAIVGPNGSGKSNVVEALRFVLGEQSMKSMRGSLGSDLIFKGSKNLSRSSRAVVTAYFDNSDKVFKLTGEGGENINLNYDTVSISREVYLDGLNKYILNGSEARLKDINNLLSSVNLGSSQHHIISQGEADRVLSASPKDRREMVEEALGLKIYQYKIKESERKLERTADNMKEVSLLRRENAPHLNFLKKQMDKFEKAREMKTELLSFYREYLKKENLYLEKEKLDLSAGKDRILLELGEIEKKISGADKAENREENGTEKERECEEKLNEIRAVKNEMERKLGRIEGMIEAGERGKEKNPELAVKNPEEIRAIFDEINSEIETAIVEESPAEIKIILLRIKDILNRFNHQYDSAENSSLISEIQNFKKEQLEILAEIKNIEEEEKKIAGGIAELKARISRENEAARAREKEKFNFRVRQQELSSSLGLISVKEENLSKETEVFENEIKEGAALVGEEIFSYRSFVTEETADRSVQEEIRRKIERIKIKLEDAGAGGGSDIIKEFEEVSQRDNFLAKEMDDLAASVESLKKLISDLKEKIDAEFKGGVKKINAEFGNFFSLMFGGGTGFLSIVSENKRKLGSDLEEGEMNEDEPAFAKGFGEAKEETTPEQGIEINVSLPQKKVKKLDALSGGERSLTSIALLFAMSQVNPPPFLVLDETDAALDEANSRKYGDMLEKLSSRSQLVLVTHNRETMSRAGVLYGVTIGADGASKLLSVKFNEAITIAK